MASSKPSVFLPVDQFTVNLQSEDGQQYLQVAMTLKVVDEEVSEAIKAQMPEVRSRVLLLLSSKKPSQLVTLEGKTALANEIAREVEATLPAEYTKASKKAKGHAETKGAKNAKTRATAQHGNATKAAPPRVLAVLFTHFIIQ